MQIRISTGDCRTAIAAALAATEAKLVEDRARLHNDCLANIKQGAEHNGVVMTPALLKEMQDIAQRDADHMMQRHMGNENILILKNFNAMLDYHDGIDIVIDDQDFNLLKDHLPKQNIGDRPDPALAAG